MSNKSGIVWGFLLVLLGAFLLVTRIMPDVLPFFEWPFTIIAVGVFLLLAALLTRNGGLAVPGCIVGGIGAIMYYQNMSGDWASWSYMWALIPGFVGVGVLLSGLIDRSGPRFESGGVVLMAISAMGFLIFGSAFGFNFFGLNMDIGNIWPLFLIGAGVIVLVGAIFQKR